MALDITTATVTAVVPVRVRIDGAPTDSAAETLKGAALSVGDRVQVIGTRRSLLVLDQPAPVGDTSWRAATFANAWVDYGAGYNPAAYRKDVRGWVHLRGLVKSGTVGATIFNIPAGYRPAFRQLFVTISNSAIGRCDVDTGGNVIAQSGSNAWFSLDGLTFLAEA